MTLANHPPIQRLPVAAFGSHSFCVDQQVRQDCSEHRKISSEGEFQTCVYVVKAGMSRKSATFCVHNRAPRTMAHAAIARSI